MIISTMVTLYNEDFFPDEVIGSVHIGSASDNEDGRHHWKQALQFPDTPCIKCYPIN